MFLGDTSFIINATQALSQIFSPLYLAEEKLWLGQSPAQFMKRSACRPSSSRVECVERKRVSHFSHDATMQRGSPTGYGVGCVKSLEGIPEIYLVHWVK